MKKTYIIIVILLIIITNEITFSQETINKNVNDTNTVLNTNFLYRGFNPHFLGIETSYFLLDDGLLKDYFKIPAWVSLFYRFYPGWITNLTFDAQLGFLNLRLNEDKESYFNLASLMISAKYNYPLNDFVDVFVRGGGGGYIAQFKGNITKRESDYSNWGYQYGAGLDIHITYNHHITLGVRRIHFYDKEMPIEGIMYNISYQYRFGSDPSLQSDDIIEIKKISIKPIFSSIYKYYSKKPIGIVKLTNISDKPIKNVKIQSYIDKYMDFPTNSKLIKEMKPNESRVIPLYAVFNNRILRLTEDTPQAIKLTFIYNHKNEIKEKIQYAQFKLYNRNAMTWDNAKKLSAFITVKDPTVKIFASSVKQAIGNGFIENYNENMQNAMAMYETLSKYQLVYAVDPNTPFVQFSQNSMMVDYIQYPRDTLRYKTGDCDDLVVLYCSLLESIGIETALITIPKHILMMYNTGIDENNFDTIHPDIENVYIYKGKVWVPLEITHVGGKFIESWKIAIEQINKYKDDPANFEIIDVKNSWKTFNPVTLNIQKWEPEIPNMKRVIRTCRRQYKTLNNKVFVMEKKNLEQKLLENPDDINALLNIGIYYARNDETKKAEEKFIKVLELDERNFYANYNMGNIMGLKKEYRKALFYFRKALEIKTHDEDTISVIDYTKSKIKNYGD